MKSPDDTVPLGTIYLEDIMAVEKSTDKPQQKFVFSLRGEDNSRTWYLSAGSEAEMDNWMNTIRNAMAAGQQSMFKAIAIHHVVVECFINRGIRVSGDVTPRLLATVGHGVSPDKKRRDERGWFCDKHLPLCAAINIFVAYGWKLQTTMESVDIVSSDDATPQPVNLAIFWRSSAQQPLSNSSSFEAIQSSSSDQPEGSRSPTHPPKPNKELPKPDKQATWLLADDQEMQNLMLQFGMGDLLN